MTTMSLKREIEEFQPDIVMSWMSRATQKIPLGKFVHVARLGGYYDAKYYQKCDQLVGNTQDIVSYLTSEGWPPEKARYLPNFVTEEKMPALDRKLYYTPDSAPLILAMGRLHENKAFDTLLQAVARVPNVYLWIAGEGPLRRELESMAEQLAVKPRVRFLGWRDDADALMQACDMFVCSSRHEPLGNIVLEAWSAAKPVVAVAAIGPSSLIGNDEAGLLVPLEDPKALARSILKLLGDSTLAARLAAEGHRRFVREYTEDTVVAKYLSFFEGIR
jgi:glycosyltransferase involved in cell wall biosynthesis